MLSVPPSTLSTRKSFEVLSNVPNPNPSRKILIAIDTETAKEVLEYSLKTLHFSSDDFVYLINARKANDNTAAGVGLNAVHNQQSETAHALLRDAAKLFIEKGTDVKAIALSGDIKQRLLEKIEQVKPDLIVIGSRGLGFISGKIFGSTSTFLAQHSKTPLLVVPLKE